ncbi:hypothetical protein K505DRAFT_105248 [Melanomma pulvis-pyrius CBS 109.77]|uniref:Uncharacterized protein n=1 Tax=Melanomma pulvis-pyrius CBS 109.77 TaxID=1314802 RepID=A0A6A6WX43_9PLEO|nr:hypothetical protein K505DRAFT_105248 [Melanomma pulvis-pyrius CBS 109.77]
MMGTCTQRNKRNRELRRRRQQLVRSSKLKISTCPDIVRTLRRGAREELHKNSAPYKWILPWTRDIFYRYEPRIYPAASLLGLPMELQQKILLNTSTPNLFEELRGKSLRRWVGILSSVAPLIRLNMVYVKGVWDKQMAELDTAKASQKTAQLSKNSECLKSLGFGTPAPYTTKAVVGSEVKIKRKQKRVRDQKCWYCEQRHHSADPLCPPARENPDLWKKLSKPRRAKRGTPQTSSVNVFQGKKVKFEDQD